MPIAEDPEPRPSEGGEPGGSFPSGAGGKDPFADLVLDEEFVRSATVKEQSGRTRMLAARWKHTPPVDPGGRRSVNDGPAAPRRRFGRRPKLQVVDPWGNPRPARRRGGRWRTPLLVLLVVAGLLASLNVNAISRWISDHGSSKADAPVPTVAPETARPTTAPPSVDPGQPTVAHPWAGSPAEGWPTGAAGIEVPRAKAIGVFDEDQVAAQLKLVKDFLVASNLDPRVTAGGRPDAALAMLDTKAREKPAQSLDTPSEETNPTRWFSRFDARDAIPVDDTVKVQGWTKLDEDGNGGVLVHTDYTFVYALRPGPDAAKLAAEEPTDAPRPGTSPAPAGATAKPVSWTVTSAADVAGDTWTARTIIRRTADFRFYDPAKYRADPQKINISKSNSFAGNSSCTLHDGFFHPAFAQFDRPHPERTGPTADPYDHSKDLDGGSACKTLSRE
ncbi:hypothetical protein ACIRVF_29430 [Kitasatospora sp. NPDC101157]|uniref:SCO2583/SCO2584 N-terminal domain-containing protein n=1 Tax=Kitasatospora sp. NPDC101157 TaxID=3364098 RepID=UPI0038252118